NSAAVFTLTTATITANAAILEAAVVIVPRSADSRPDPREKQRELPQLSTRQDGCSDGQPNADNHQDDENGCLKDGHSDDHESECDLGHYNVLSGGFSRSRPCLNVIVDRPNTT